MIQGLSAEMYGRLRRSVMASGVLWMPWTARLEAVISGQPVGGRCGWLRRIHVGGSCRKRGDQL